MHCHSPQCHRTVKTFRPKKSAPFGLRGLHLKRHLDATLGNGNILDAVKLPPGEDLNEWLALNIVEFYNALSVLYGTLEEFCTSASCPVMFAGGKYEYLWADGVKVVTPVRLSAHEYIGKLYDWIDEQLSDERLFPREACAPFPPHFRELSCTILKRLFRVYAHVYHSHFDTVRGLGEEAHLKTCFQHFVVFVKHFGLVDEAELEPLKELIRATLVRLAGEADTGAPGSAAASASA